MSAANNVSHRTLKAVLLSKPNSPFWLATREIFKEKPDPSLSKTRKRGSNLLSQDEIAFYLGVTRQAIHGWHHGTQIQNSTVLAMKSRFRRNWTRIQESMQQYIPDTTNPNTAIPIDELFNAIMDDNVGVEYFGQLLGLKPDAASKMIDIDFFTDAPLMTDMYYPGKKYRKMPRSLEEDQKFLIGHYNVSIERTDGQRKIRMENKLQVKYAVEVKNKRWLIKTKMNVKYYIEGKR